MKENSPREERRLSNRHREVKKKSEPTSSYLHGEGWLEGVFNRIGARFSEREDLNKKQSRRGGGKTRRQRGKEAPRSFERRKKIQINLKIDVGADQVGERGNGRFESLLPAVRQVEGGVIINLNSEDGNKGKFVPDPTL